ncbi:ISNCY-like element ISCde2 family transposase [Candidatus Desulforudis audaxviator]|uniref:Putative methyl-accepting chemotaxis sensory transducer n=1 Tax=Desulforudis audaxviator (strain MP104C) TaxID=477974 RepID=B1I2G1_DESAP|nr:ISNCY-like element ISCde2 family transposase [Candidatus Desulforudis audaxviator]ACA59226.1 putative methyl-accepting chemotaxis sensory transducer [Candidatus Desulforudis audaxviator MP104C]ACA60303.1 putative methyl-accepting chemotaxis sensory transducer [Candidatus Desulforudis audaxviator MP104C]ACA60304.1 putative methyl-accepting chemotaxis sensory transducer [Candidatus Desulforudis audaxviator MP104C]ACA60305.1 putative methyl-accepting chemotaxis sensory transducer [Candidatus De
MLCLRQEESRQVSFLDYILPPEVLELPEDLAKLDAWLDDERFFEPFQDKYHRCLGRPSVPAETYLRMTALKHQYRLSDRQVCALVKDRISWRRFCRIPWNKPVPHPSSLTKIRQRLDADGSDHMAALNAHLVRKAQEEKLLKSRNKVRVDTTAIEANIHHPTDSGLIADSVRVVTRLAKKIQAVADNTSVAIRDRTRSIKKRVLAIAKVLKRRTGESIQEVRRITGEMADIAEKTLQDARNVVQHLHQQARHLAGTARDEKRRLAARLEKILDLGEQIVSQARQVNAGQLNLPERVVSLSDPEARPIRRGKAHKETEFGYKVRLTESTERLVTEYDVMMGNPPDHQLLIPGIAEHIHRTGRVPEGTATDRGFWNAGNESALQALGIRKISLPYKGKRSHSRTGHERQSWFRRLQRWRAGQEGTISVLKRRYGLKRTLYRGLAGCRRWVGGAVWGYNLNRIAKLI